MLVIYVTNAAALQKYCGLLEVVFVCLFVSNESIIYT